MTNLISNYSLYCEAIRVTHKPGCRVHKLRKTKEGIQLLNNFTNVWYPQIEPNNKEIEKYIDPYLKGFIEGYSMNMVDDEETEP